MKVKLFEEYGNEKNDSLLLIIELLNKNDLNVIHKKGLIINSVEEFKEKIKKFKTDINYYEDYEDDPNFFIRLRPVKDKIGSLSKEDEDFIEELAWNTGDHYELLY